MQNVSPESEGPKARLGDKVVALSFIVLILLANILLFADWSNEKLMYVTSVAAKVGFCGLVVGVVIKLFTLLVDLRNKSGKSF